MFLYTCSYILQHTTIHLIFTGFNRPKTIFRYVVLSPIRIYRIYISLRIPILNINIRHMVHKCPCTREYTFLPFVWVISIWAESPTPHRKPINRAAYTHSQLPISHIKPGIKFDLTSLNSLRRSSSNMTVASKQLGAQKLK